MKDEILKILYDTPGYVSGEKISEALGVSRSYVWKLINKLRREGYEIDSAENKGYILKKDGDRLDKFSVTQGLDTKYIGREVYCFETLDSTNTYAKGQDVTHGSVFIAEEQQAGKGRMGRKWLSPPGDGLWMTVYLKPEMEIREIMRISLVGGMAVCGALRRLTGAEVMIKWPNDVVIKGKKVCGILTEMVTEEQRVIRAVAGMGVNVNTASFSGELQDKATSLYLETGKRFSRGQAAKLILEDFEKYYDMISSASLIKEYEKLCVNIGKTVIASSPAGEITGTAVAVTPLGELEISLPEGGTVKVSSGEVSVRGVYGYI